MMNSKKQQNLQKKGSSETVYRNTEAGLTKQEISNPPIYSVVVEVEEE